MPEAGRRSRVRALSPRDALPSEKAAPRVDLQVSRCAAAGSSRRPLQLGRPSGAGLPATASQGQWIAAPVGLADEILNASHRLFGGEVPRGQRRSADAVLDSLAWSLWDASGWAIARWPAWH